MGKTNADFFFFDITATVILEAALLRNTHLGRDAWLVVVQIQTRVQTQRFVICISAIPVVQWVPEESGHFYCVLVKHTQNTARMGFEPVLFGLEWNGREIRGMTLKLQYSSILM